MKRFADIALAGVLAIPVGLIVLVCAALIALTGQRPFYTQDRLGHYTNPLFKIWKLRTMIDMDFEAWLNENPEALAEYGIYCKLEDDPRVTRIGKFLRKYSLDELPQLYNVLRGDMSLVGPRPLLPDERIEYSGVFYETMRPGITGLWQVSDHGGPLRNRGAYDDHYAVNSGMVMDLGILLHTPMAMISNK